MINMRIDCHQCELWVAKIKCNINFVLILKNSYGILENCNLMMSLKSISIRILYSYCVPKINFNLNFVFKLWNVYDICAKWMWAMSW